MWDVNTYELKSSNCWDGAIIAFLKRFQYNYHYIEMNRLVVNYFKPSSPNIDECLYSMYFHRDIALMHRYLNIETTFCKLDNKSVEVIKKSLQHAPVGIWIDAYDCDWLPFYKNVHFEHFCLIIDICEEERRLICRDIHSVSNTVLDISRVMGAEMYIFTPHERVKERPDDLFLLLCDSIRRIDEKKQQEECKSFIQYMESTFNVTEQRKRVQTMESSMVLLKLLWMAEGKDTFSSALTFLQSQISSVDFTRTKELLMKSKRMIEKLRNLLIKAFILNHIKQASIVNTIDSLYLNDMSVVESLKKELGGCKGV